MVSLNVVSVTFPHLSYSMLTTMVMCHNFMLEKHLHYTISMFQLIRVLCAGRVLGDSSVFQTRVVKYFFQNFIK